jgi:hypothetical protein
MSDARYRLVIHSYPAEEIIPRVCKLLYGSTDKNLLASLSSLPYIVGRSFSLREVDDLEDLLKQCEVGFTFKSSTDGFPDRSFDPKRPHASASQTTEIELPSIRSIPKRFVASALILGVLTAALLLVRWDFHSIQEFDHAQQQAPAPETYYARIAELNNSVDVKAKTGVVWEKAKLEMKLEQEDSVRTYDRSTAKVDYANGSSIAIKPNTLIVIGRTNHQLDKRIDLEDGSIQTRLMGSATPYKMTIHTKAGVIEIKAPDKPNQESRLETKIEGKELKVRVSEGTATLLPSNPKMKPIQIHQQQVIAASPEKPTKPLIAAPAAKPRPLELMSPQKDARVRVNPQDAQPIAFECQNLGSDVYYIWEMASDESMQNILLKQTTQEPQLKVNYLDLGTVYWRVVAESYDAHFISQPRRLYVEKQHD